MIFFKQRCFSNWFFVGFFFFGIDVWPITLNNLISLPTFNYVLRTEMVNWFLQGQAQTTTKY